MHSPALYYPALDCPCYPALICVLSYMSSHMRALSCMCSHMCSPLCALLCVLSSVCSPMFALLCVLSYVCSHLCARICLISYVCFHMCALICLLSCALICLLLCALICVSSSSSSPPLVSSPFAPPHCLGSLAGIFFFWKEQAKSQTLEHVCVIALAIFLALCYWIPRVDFGWFTVLWSSDFSSCC